MNVPYYKRFILYLISATRYFATVVSVFSPSTRSVTVAVVCGVLHTILYGVLPNKKMCGCDHEYDPKWKEKRDAARLEHLKRTTPLAKQHQLQQQFVTVQPASNPTSPVYA